jgi:DNA-binding NarL/FixJ family response regulator
MRFQLLPRHTLPPQPASGPNQRPATMNPALHDQRAVSHGLKCFVVEDSAVIRQNLVATLEELLDIQVVGTAEDERTALDWARAGEYACDLMIIDIFLKSGSGLEVLRQVRQMRPDTRTVVLTNYATPDIRRRCADLGADRVFDKSAELDELLAYCEGLAGAGGP